MGLIGSIYTAQPRLMKLRSLQRGAVYRSHTAGPRDSSNCVFVIRQEDFISQIDPPHAVVAGVRDVQELPIGRDHDARVVRPGTHEYYSPRHRMPVN